MKKVDYIWFNGEMVCWEDVKVYVMLYVLYYGILVFEGICCYDLYKGLVVFCYCEYMQCLYDFVKIYCFLVLQSIDELMEVCCDVICKNNFISVYICLLIFVGDVGMGVNLLVGYLIDVIIVVFLWGVYLGVEVLEQGIDVMVFFWNCVVLNIILIVVKVGGNYFFFLLVGSEACCYGYQEGIVLDVNGYIFEGVGENLFEVKDGVLFILLFIFFVLLGIICDVIIKLVKELGIDVCEQVLLCEFLYLVDEVFMFGIVVEITLVCSVDGIQVGEGCCGLVIKCIQ